MRRVSLRFMRLSLGIALTAILSIIVHAQFRAGVQGTVTDIAGAVVPGATVTLTNKETGQTQRVVTTDEGFYRFSALSPGTYTVTVEQQSFKKKVVDDVKVDAESVRGVDVQLEAGGISEVVTVEADPAPLETEDANVRKTITTVEVQRLPQAGRDVYELIRLAPGVFGAGARSSSGGSVGLPNTSGPGGSSIGIFETENRPPVTANGQRVSANNFQIDGVSVNSQTWGGAAVITPTQESVKEVQVTSSTYSAEDGRNSGAQVKVVTQNGTNQFHGSAFFKYNDPGWNAFNGGFVIPGTTRGVPSTRVNDRDKTFGGSLGGPVWRNKLFFFFAYEGLRTSSNNFVESFIETQQLRQFIISRGGISSQILQEPGVEPRVVAILPRTCADFSFPNGNNCRLVAGGFDLGSPTGSLGNYFAGNQSLGGGFDNIPDVQYALLENPTSTEGDQYVTRIDFDATEKDKFFFTLFYTPRLSIGNDTAAQSRPMAIIRSDRLNYNTAFTYIRSFSPTILNEARVNFTKWGFNEVDSNPDINFGVPRVEIEGFLPGGARLRFGANRSANTPGTLHETQLNIRDTLTWITGNHALKFGADYRQDVNKNPGTGAARPLYSFVGPWNFANDAPIFEAISAGFSGEPIAANADFNSGGLAFFVQDDWKVRPNLTLNLGLRWEYFKPISSEDGLGVLIFGPNGLVDSRVEVRDKLYESDYNNFGPQIGFAWSPRMFEDKLVVRGGFGMGYDRLPNALPANSRANPPNGARYGICCGTIGNPFVGGQILYTLGSDRTPTSYPGNPNLGGGLNPNTGGPNVGTIEIYGIEQEFSTPQVYRYSLEAQYELPWRLVGSLAYQGSKSENFVRIEPLHNTQPARSPVFNPVFFGFGDVHGNYNGMNARLQRRYSNGFQFDLNYRFAKSLDSYSFEAPCACTNQTYPVDQDEEFGPSDYDVRHFVTLSGLWDLPFYRNQRSWVGKILGGWQINGILTRHTGFPWTPTISSNLRGPNGNFFGPVRPVFYNGQRPDSNTNENFLRPGGIFPGGGAAFFSTTINGDTYQANPPGVGRNTFFGPKYFNVDMSVSKRFGLPSFGVLGENPNFDIRFNFFNILNSQNLAPFGTASSNRVNNPNFGEPTALLAGRVVEMQLRFSF